MERMIGGLVIVFVMVASLIILYAVLGEPLSYIAEILVDVDSTTGDMIEDTMNFIVFMFGATIVIGIGLYILLFAVYGHKKEYE